MKRIGHIFGSIFQVGSGFFLNRTVAFNSTRKLCVVATVYVSKTRTGKASQETVGKIQVVCNDLTQEKVDVIVNAANGHLNHGGGVAAAIVRMGGISIQQESNAYVTKHGPVPTGEAVLTQSGKLPCKAIIHAVGPVWQGGNKGELKTLQNAVYNSLQICHINKFTSIAMPAISSGIFGFPKELCAKLLFTVAIDFLRSQENSTLTCVRFTNFDQPTVDVFKGHAQSLSNEPGLRVEIGEEQAKL